MRGLLPSRIQGILGLEVCSSAGPTAVVEDGGKVAQGDGAEDFGGVGGGVFYGDEGIGGDEEAEQGGQEADQGSGFEPGGEGGVEGLCVGGVGQGDLGY